MEFFRSLPKGIYFLIFAVCICKQLLHIDARNSHNLTFTKVLSTKHGPVRGKEVKLSTGKTVFAYLGIPYAVAERFEKPQSASKWQDVLNATNYRKVCHQPRDCFEENIPQSHQRGMSLYQRVRSTGGYKYICSSRGLV